MRDTTRIMSVHDPEFEFSGGKERVSCRRKRQGADPYSSKKKSFVLFQFDQIKFDCGAWEPLFCKVYLYDALHKRKLSEDYRFHISNKQELELLDDTVREHLEQIQNANIYQKPTVLFRTNDPHVEVYIIVLIERVLQGIPDESDRVYEKDPKLKEKVLKKNKESIKKLSHFRQPFLIGAFNVYSQNSDKSLNIVDGIRIVKFRKLNRMNAREMFDIGKYLPETESTGQDLVLWASMRVEIKSVDSDSLNDLFVTYQQSKQKMDSRLHPVHAQRNIRANRFGLETSLCTFFDVADEFPYEMPLMPSLEFKNTLYVYLDSADFSFASYKHTTFVVEAFVKKSDEVQATRIECIGDMFNPDRLTTSALSSVTKHERYPQFMSEFRIEVPMDAYTTNCHLFFEIFAVKTNAFESEPHQYGRAVLKSVGSSFLVLFNESNAMLRDGLHALPIYSKIDNGYLQDDSKSTKIKGYNLNVRSRHASTIFMQDCHAALFLHCLDDLHELLSKWNVTDRKTFEYFDKMSQFLDRLNRDIPNIVKANFVEVIRHSHVLLNSTLAVLSQLRIITPTEDDFDNYSSDDELMFLHSWKKQSKLLIGHIFNSLLYCLHGITAVEGRKGRENKTLMSYIDTFFNLPRDNSFFSTIFDYWIEFIDSCDMEKFAAYNHKFDNQFHKGCNRRRKSWTRIEHEKETRGSTTPRQKFFDDTAQDSPLNVLDAMSFSWFFFEASLKHLMLSSNKTPEVMSKFQLGLQELIRRLCPIMISCTKQRKTKGVLSEVARRCNYDMALFFRDLIQFTGMEFVDELVDCYLAEMLFVEGDSSDVTYSKVSHKMDFLDLYTEYEGFMNLYIDRPQRAHYIIECMIENIAMGTKHDQSDLRLKSVYVFRKHLTKLDFDTKFSMENDPKQASRLRIMHPYFKFIQLFLEDTSLLQNAPTAQTIVDVLVCVYSILLFTEKERVLEWLDTDPTKYVSSFYDMLLLTVIIIRKYEQAKTRTNLVKIFPKVFSSYVESFCVKMSTQFVQLATGLNTSLRKLLDGDSANSEEEVIYTMANTLESDNFPMLNEFIKLFDKCSYFYVNVMLVRPYIDTGIFLDIVSGYVHPFLQTFHPFYLLSRVVRLKNADAALDINIHESGVNKFAKYETTDAWQMMTASILLNTALPIDLSVPVFNNCLQILLLIYRRKEEATVGEEEEEESANQNEEQEQPMPLYESPKKSEPNNRTSIVSGGFLNYTNENSHMIRAATFRKLVERLFQNNPGYTPPFNDCFLLTYFSIASSNQVLHEIITITHDVRHETDKSQKLLRVVNALKMWVTEHFVNMDCTILASFITFLSDDLTRIIRDELATVTYHKPLLSSLLRKMLDVQPEKKQQTSINPEPLILPPRFPMSLLHNMDKSSFNLFEWDSLELARQITLLDAKYFMQIQHTELIAKKKTFDSPELSVRMATAPNLTKMCLQFDSLSSWVQACILSQTTVDERVKYIRKLFDICEKLYEIGNFHSCFAVRSGFRQSGVIRLAKTWQKIPQIEDIITKKYGEVFKHPYTNLLAEYDMRPPPMVPLAAQLQAEVTFASLNGKYVPEKVSPSGEKLVNYDRMRLLSRVIRRLKIKQQITYNFTPIPFLIEYFSHLDSMDEDTAYNTSLELEPKNREMNQQNQ